MKLTFSDKTEMFGEGIFAVLNEKKNQMLAEGKTIYNLSVGTRTLNRRNISVRQWQRQQKSRRIISILWQTCRN